MRSRYLRLMVYLSLAGSLFAGYLSAKKLFTNVCAFNEGCPYFLGYPACWFGFGFFFIMLVISFLGMIHIIEVQKARITLLIISAIGILFAGRFVVLEIPNIISGAIHYSLGLPTCAYGLIFYILIFVFSLKHTK